MHPITTPAHVVLIVDDEEIIRLMAVDVLNDAGFATFEARDAADALEQIVQHPEIDLLFTDINMPGGVDGLALARMVYRSRPDVRLILTSGRERPTPSQIPDHGQFIQKPYRLHTLLGMIEAA